MEARERYPSARITLTHTSVGSAIRSTCQDFRSEWILKRELKGLSADGSFATIEGSLPWDPENGMLPTPAGLPVTWRLQVPFVGEVSDG